MKIRRRVLRRREFDSFHVGSVDGKRAELQRLIETAESIQRQPIHTEQQ